MWSCDAHLFRWWCHPSASLLVLTDLLNVVLVAGGQLVLDIHVLQRYFVGGSELWTVVTGHFKFFECGAECVPLANSAAPTTAESD